MHLMCAICTELMNEGDHIDATTCGHIYHHQCIEPWVRSSQNCPQCREPVPEESLMRVFPTSGEAASGVSRLDADPEENEANSIQSLNQLLSSVREELSVQNSDVVLLQAQLQSLEELRERESMTLADALRRNAYTAKIKLKNMKQKVTILEKHLQRSNTKSNELRMVNLDLTNRLQEAESDVRSARTALADSQRTVIDLEQHLDGAKKKTNKLKESNRQLTQRVEMFARVEKEKSETELRVAALQRELSSQNTYIAELKTRLKSMEKSERDSQTVIENMKRGITWNWYITDTQFYKSQLYFGELPNRKPEALPCIPQAVATVLNDFVEVPTTPEVLTEPLIELSDTELIALQVESNGLAAVTNVPEAVTNAPEAETNVPEAVSTAYEAVLNVPEAVTNAPEAVTNVPEAETNVLEAVLNALEAETIAPEAVPTAYEAVLNAMPISNASETDMSRMPVSDVSLVHVADVSHAPESELTETVLTIPEGLPMTSNTTPRPRLLQAQHENYTELVPTTPDACIAVSIAPESVSTAPKAVLIAPQAALTEPETVLTAAEAVPNTPEAVPTERSTALKIPLAPQTVATTPPVPKPRVRSIQEVCKDHIISVPTIPKAVANVANVVVTNAPVAVPKAHVADPNANVVTPKAPVADPNAPVTVLNAPEKVTVTPKRESIISPVTVPNSPVPTPRKRSTVQPCLK